MESFVLDNDFSRFPSNPNVYTKKVGDHLIILVFHVDDFLLTIGDPKLLTLVKSILNKKLEMTNLGHLHYFFGLQVLQSKEGVFISQSKYACDNLHHFHIEDYKTTPSLFYY